MKKNLFSLIGLCLSCVLLFTLTACFEGEDESTRTPMKINADGIYYAYENGEINKNSSIKLNGNKYTIKSSELGYSEKYTITGTFEVYDDGEIIFLYAPESLSEFGSMMIDEYGWKAGERRELFGGRIEEGAITMTSMLGVERPSPIVFYLDGILPDEVKGNYDGTYYGYEDGETYEDAYILLNKGTYKLHDSSFTVSGSFEVTDGRIVLWYVIDADRTLDQQMMADYGYSDGESFELFSGRIEDGKITLTKMRGERQFPDQVYYLDGIVTDEDDALYDGSYYLYEDGEIYDDSFIRLNGSKFNLQRGLLFALSGWFEVNGTEIDFWYEIKGDSEFDQGLMATYSYQEGATVKLFSGRILNGRIVFTDAPGTTQPAEEVYFLNGEVW